MTQPARKVPRCLFAALAVLLIFAGCKTPPPPLMIHDSASYHTAPPSARPEPKRIRQRTLLPRVMLMIDEKNLGSIATSEVQALGTAQLRVEGVSVIDQDMVRANIGKDQQMLKMSGDDRGAAALGMQFGAEVMIVGEAVAKPSARRIAESNLRNYQAVVTVRAVRTDNSRTIASASETESVVALDDVTGGSKALKKAAEKAFTSLVPTLLDEWEREGGTLTASSMNHIVLTVGGVDKTWKLKAVREMLQGMDDAVENVVQRSYAAGLAVLELDSAVPAGSLGERLILAAPEGIKFQLVEAGPGKLTLRAVESR